MSFGLKRIGTLRGVYWTPCDFDRIPKRIGTVFYWRGRMWRRGRGILYVAHPADPTIEAAYRKRQKRRQKRTNEHTHVQS